MFLDLFYLFTCKMSIQTRLLAHTLVILVVGSLAEIEKSTQRNNTRPTYCGKLFYYCKSMSEFIPQNISKELCNHTSANTDADIFFSSNGKYTYSYGTSPMENGGEKMFVRQCTGKNHCLDIRIEFHACLTKPLPGSRSKVVPAIPDIGGIPTVLPPVFGGNPVRANTHPWMVFIEPSYCGGTIISSRHILTAAHCLYNFLNFKLNKVTIHTGRHDLSQDESLIEQTQIVNASNFIIHPKYNNTNLNNDIAILLLNKPLEVNDWTVPVLLPKSKKVNINKKLCKVYGWGKTEHGLLSNVLLEANIKKRKCKLPPEDLKNVKHDTMFCAHESGRDSCKGDSGGPLLCKINGKWIQFGIVSWGPAFSCGLYSGVYTKVTNYINWIQQSITIDGSWGQWTGFTGCSVTCRGGFESRVRLCNNPLPIAKGTCRQFIGDKRTDPTSKAIMDVDWNVCNTREC